MIEVKEVLDLNSSFQKLIKTSNAIQKKCSDYNITKVNSNNFEYDPFQEVVRYTTDEKEKREVPISDYAFSQICAKLGISVSYLQKCKNAGKIELIGDNINAWVQDLNKDLFIREYDGTIRGVLSQKYSVLDTPDILNVASDFLKDFEIKGAYLSPERLHIRAVPTEMLPIPREDMFAGVQIDSSDVGRNILSAKFFVYKQVCTNGLILPVASDLYSQKHISIKADDFREGFREGFKKLPMVAEQFIAQVRVARNEKVPYSFHSEEAVNAFALDMKQKAGLSENDSKKVIELMQYTYDDSRMGMIHSLTDLAKSKALEARLQLEKFAGRLLVA